LLASANRKKAQNYGSATIAATIISKMRAQTIGRVLGAGLRMAGERLAGVDKRAAGVTAGRASGGLVRGVGGFLRPFRRVGGILWLEITGVFFLLPVVAFAPRLWAVRASWAHGPDHWRFLLTLGLMTVFFYLSASSFWRARRR
jgi:hypothetical protein